MRVYRVYRRRYTRIHCDRIEGYKHQHDSKGRIIHDMENASRILFQAFPRKKVAADERGRVSSWHQSESPIYGISFYRKMDAREQIAARFPVIMQMVYRLPVKTRTKIIRISESRGTRRGTGYRALQLTRYHWTRKNL